MTVKQNLHAAFQTLCKELGHSLELNRIVLENVAKVQASKVFSSQKSADRAKKLLGRKGFNQLISLFFHDMLTPDDFDFEKLDQDLAGLKKVMERHLGTDKMVYLGLLVTVRKSLEPAKAGLLFKRSA